METLITAKISSVGQITLPSAVRKILNVGAGDEIEMVMKDGEVAMRKAETKEERIRRVFAEFDRLNEEHQKRMTPKQKRFAEMSRGWTANQYREYIDNLPETRAYMKEKYGI